MKTSKKGLEFITKWEGIVLNPYMDIASLWTIGVGHLIRQTDSFSTISNDQIKDLLSSKDKNHPVSKLSISREEAIEILSKDVEKTEIALNEALKVPLTQNQFDALVSFGFNCGPGVYKTSGAFKELNSGNFSLVAEKLLDWSKARINGELKVNKGLLARRKSEGTLFETPDEFVGSGGTIEWSGELLNEVQSQLKNLGLYKGSLDGIMGPLTLRGINEFSNTSKVSPGLDPRNGITLVWLYALKKAVK